MNPRQPVPVTNDRSDFADSLRKGALLGAALLMLVLPPGCHFSSNLRSNPPPPQVASQPAPKAAAPVAPKAAPPAAPGAVRLAQFGKQVPSKEVRQVANWALTSGDNQNKSIVIVDKKAARVYVLDPNGRLQAAAPALLGSAIGDDTAPGVGDKPLAQVLPEEKTTPAGRFIAEVGQSSSRGEDVVWVDYDAAVSMHRVLKVPERLKSIASKSVSDNRMSFGCINLPTAFYEKVLRPAADRGAVIYVLPETRALRQTFASFYDVQAPVKVAQR
jgi:hypothetical protein